MKTKKIFICILICMFITGLLSSCAIDKKCPAYTQATSVTTDIRA